MKQWLFLCLTLTAALNGEDWFQEPLFQKHLDAKTQSKETFGNRVELLVNGGEAFKKRMDNLSSADFILLKAYELHDDLIGNAIIDKLIEKASQGTKVFLQFDLVGQYVEEQHQILTDLRNGKAPLIPPIIQRFIDGAKGNGFVVPTSFPTSFYGKLGIYWTPKDHEKYWITGNVKDKVLPVKVILGGINIGETYLFPPKTIEEAVEYEKEGFKGLDALPMRDTDIELQGPVVEAIVARFVEAAELQLQTKSSYYLEHAKPYIEPFLKELKSLATILEQNKQLAYPTDIGKASVRYVYKSSLLFPTKDHENIRNLFVSMIDKVPRDASIYMASCFFLPPKVVWKAMAGAVRRGVNFKILLNQTRSAEVETAGISELFRLEVRDFLKIMPSRSFDFYEWQGDPKAGIGNVLHEKVYLFGMGEMDPCCIGSSNLDSMSLRWDSENLVVIQDPEFKKQVNAMIERDFSEPHSKKIYIEDTGAENLWQAIRAMSYDKFLRDFL